jgi:hypothetical protein
MRPKARGLAQHVGPPGWLEERDPAGCDFDRDGRAMPPILADRSACLCLELLITSFCHIQLLLLMFYRTSILVHKTPPWATPRKEYSSRPMPSLWVALQGVLLGLAWESNPAGVICNVLNGSYTACLAGPYTVRSGKAAHQLRAAMAHWKEDSNYVFPEIKLRGLIPNFSYIWERFIYSQNRSY